MSEDLEQLTSIMRDMSEILRACLGAINDTMRASKDRELLANMASRLMNTETSAYRDRAADAVARARAILAAIDGDTIPAGKETP